MPEHVLRIQEPQGRIDSFVAEALSTLSRSAVQRLIVDGEVLVNGRPTRASYRPEPGDTITVRVPDIVLEAPRAEALPLTVVYEDERLLVIDKPAGLTVHPGARRPSGTLVNALLAYRPEIARADLDPQRPGIVHRLDRETSGLLVVAADREAQSRLQGMFKGREVHKVYLALVYGQLLPEQGAIEAPIGRDPIIRRRMAILPEGGRPARTEYLVRESLPGATLIEATLVTGRTHQIRVHLASIGHPVVGDSVYGRRRQRISAPRQFLHAWRLAFTHPFTGEALAFTSELPPDLVRVLEDLRQEPSQTVARAR